MKGLPGVIDESGAADKDDWGEDSLEHYRGPPGRLYYSDSANALPTDITSFLYGRLWVDFARKGISLGAHDLMIASTCLALGFSVITLNIRDYDKIGGLRIVRFRG